ncbi:signal transduction histidine kinase/CheY-like chemotaxis protein [Pedobacter sp. AK017]|uniref:hybrid sensor histidine kinase/response regulator n=1 Tax=Pedobacter sp. AK017 TaxID=2723073 RepID=UPI001613193E|nr:ATP-binding protein [Pedobacter sp. AK017]MBB5439472.1 signal transduction histidine kinase/CheY-like chemotaxis protein [Pedobacter sp. AK017]
MKPNYTRLLARKIILTFLTIVIVLAIAALFVRNNITRQLAETAELAANINLQLNPEETLQLLHQAEDDFQQSLAHINGPKTSDYKFKLGLVFNKIDTLLKIHADTSQLSDVQAIQVRQWYQKKIQLSDRLVGLKRNFDSLLTAYAEFNTRADEKNAPVITNRIKTSEKKVKANTDTVSKVVPVERKGLFGRLKDAISNKNNDGKILEISHNNSTNTIENTLKEIIAVQKTENVKKLKQLQAHYLKLLSMQRELITLNAHISNELERIVTDLKEINYNMASDLKTMALKNYQQTSTLLNKFYLAALCLIILFAILLILFITQLNRAELLLRGENERAVKIAQQKMDLLLNMSHEIRNPLTAIKGFLYIFGKTNLSERQTEMLESIKSSSDMLLRTLNDTLDAGKMENSDLKIECDPFNPDYIINQVMESMSYSAAKKQLGFQYHFKGNKEALVLGDSFRLKQILVNLLSNAIKYTNKGGITLNAELLTGETTMLQVDVTDTGEGISAEQQVNLFSKYYQTSSSKGQIGTGLGLFICKQLVEMQGGKISVKSISGTGTTFSFFIPYKKNEIAADRQVQDPISLLNGLNILAVDDNELNLMFLKVMMAKWNVKFQQASNGRAALEIINKHPVDLVLTDLQMPELDGKQLLSAIRALAKPLNQLPVIVISGTSEPADEQLLLKQGFSGLVGKPFIETELIAQLVKALKT